MDYAYIIPDLAHSNMLFAENVRIVNAMPSSATSSQQIPRVNTLFSPKVRNKRKAGDLEEGLPQKRAKITTPVEESSNKHSNMDSSAVRSNPTPDTNILVAKTSNKRSAMDSDDVTPQKRRKPNTYLAMRLSQIIEDVTSNLSAVRPQHLSTLEVPNTTQKTHHVSVDPTGIVSSDSSNTATLVRKHFNSISIRSPSAVIAAHTSKLNKLIATRSNRRGTASLWKIKTPPQWNAVDPLFAIANSKLLQLLTRDVRYIIYDQLINEARTVLIIPDQSHSHPLKALAVVSLAMRQEIMGYIDSRKMKLSCSSIFGLYNPLTTTFEIRYEQHSRWRWSPEYTKLRRVYHPAAAVQHRKALESWQDAMIHDPRNYASWMAGRDFQYNPDGTYRKSLDVNISFIATGAYSFGGWTLKNRMLELVPFNHESKEMGGVREER